MTASNIETSVRTMRYQALFHACREANIHKLLVAHHEGDQYETILSRLSTFHNRGLVGIYPLNNIPECSDLYGAESGVLRRDSIPYHPERNLLGVQGIETGGIQIGRPLLTFGKDRLVATCEKYNVPWIEDPSNKDKTLTSRNAIRFILQKHKLPAALSKESLLELSRLKEEQKKASTQHVEDLFNNSDIELDIRTGFLTAIVPEPRITGQNIAEAAIPEGAIAEHSKEIRTGLARRLARLVAPEPNLERSSFAVAAEKGDNFTAGGVHFICSQDESRKGTRKWTLVRRPLSSKLMPWDPVEGYISKEPNLALSFPPTKDNQQSTFRLWDGRYWIRIHNSSEHTLWVRPMTSDHISSLRDLLRSKEVQLNWFQPDLNKDKVPAWWDKSGIRNPANLANLNGPMAITAFDKIMSEIAKGQARFTIPIIEARDLSVQRADIASAAQDTDAEAHASAVESQQDEEKTPNWQGKILAFPTLGLRVVGRGRHADWPTWSQTQLKWDIRYKKIDLGKKKLEECIVGMTRPRKSPLELDSKSHFKRLKTIL
jgi:hypothetical protein